MIAARHGADAAPSPRTRTSVARRVSIATAVSAAQSIAIQLIAVATLAPLDYGTFGLVYLAFAWSVSLSLSVVSEPWARSTVERRAAWSRYAGALLVLLACGATVLLVVLLIIRPGWPVWVLAAAALLAAYRVSARYHSAAELDLRWMTLPDLVSLITTVLVWAVAAAYLAPLEAVAVAWSTGGATGALLSRPLPVRALSARAWMRDHRARIRVLVAESLLLDAGSIGMPLLLTAPLGVGGYGVFRAAQSMTTPALLLLTPLRPILGRASRSTAAGGRALALVVAAGTVTASLVVAGVGALELLDLLRGSAIRALVPHLPAVGVIVAAALPTHYCYLAARVHLAGAALLRARILSLALTLALPLIGVAVGGLSGALWGFAASVLLGGGVLAIELVRAARAEEAPR